MRQIPKKRIVIVIIVLVILAAVVDFAAAKNCVNYDGILNGGFVRLDRNINLSSHSSNSEVIDTILDMATAEFIGGYPVDENFLLYISKKYGNDCLLDIVNHGEYKNPEEWFLKTDKSIHVLWYEYCNSTGMAYFSQDNIYRLKTKGDEVVFDFTGDIAFAEEIGTTAFMDEQLRGVESCFSRKLLKEMKNADLLVVNNEFAYTKRGTPIPNKAYTLRGNPSRVKNLHTIGVDLVGIANNHVYDFGQEGMEDTLHTLEEEEIPYVGAGYNINDAMKPAYYIVNGRKIAIVAATQIEKSYSYTKEATENTPGVLKCLKDEKFCKEIADAKKCSDMVIVFVHWGTEGNSNYGTDQSALARDFVESGADAIIGGHTHCLQAVEYMDEVPIYYSLGNFFFTPTNSLPDNYDTGIAQLRIDKNCNIKSYFLPCSFDKGVVSLLAGEEKNRILANIWRLSTTTRVDVNSGLIERK